MSENIHIDFSKYEYRKLLNISEAKNNNKMEKAFTNSIFSDPISCLFSFFHQIRIFKKNTKLHPRWLDWLNEVKSV